jgi:hypothetical protein
VHHHLICQDSDIFARKTQNTDCVRIELLNTFFSKIRAERGLKNRSVVIPKLKMAMPFLVLKNHTGFEFQYTKV